MSQENRKKLTKTEKEKIGLKCASCESAEGLEYHHIVPLAVGGSNLISNYVCLCYICHGKIHGITNPKNRSELTKAGIARAKAEGKRIGCQKGDKLTTKKSVDAKEQIKKLNYDFLGTLTNEETYKQIGISRNSFYKYKKELKMELGLND